jgi:hypothetical protein
MRLKSAALFAVGFLSVTFWLHGGARCQSSLAPPLSLAPPPSDQGSPPEGTRNLASPGVVDPWETIRRRAMTAKGSPSPATKNVWPPTAAEDVPQRTGTSARSAGAKNSPPPATAKDAPSPAFDNPSPAPRIGKLSPAQEPGPDGFTVGIDGDEETGRPLPVRPRPAKQSKARQKPDTAEGSSAIQPLGDQAEVEKLKPKLTICRGC